MSPDIAAPRDAPLLYAAVLLRGVGGAGAAYYILNWSLLAAWGAACGVVLLPIALDALRVYWREARSPPAAASAGGEEDV